MTFITLIVRYTIDLNCLVVFDQLKCVISVNIVDSVFFPWISAEIKPKLNILKSVHTENENSMSFITLVVRDIIDLNSLLDVEQLKSTRFSQSRLQAKSTGCHHRWPSETHVSAWAASFGGCTLSNRSGDDSVCNNNV